MRVRLWWLVWIAILFGAASCSPAAAQDYPSRTVTIVAPSAPGGLYSLFARLIAGKLEQRLGRSFIVENRPGAGSVVGSVSVARSAPDGYTLMVATTTGMAVNVTLHKSLPYDPAADFAPIMLIADVPEVLVVNAALPVHSLADLVKLAKTTPGGLTFGSAGAGAAQHIEGEMLKNALAIEMTHVPYKGMSPAINDVAGGHITLMFSPIPIAQPLIEAGRLRAIAVTTRERVAAFPDAPPLRELGIEAFDAASWFMLVAPARTPAAVIDRLFGELRVVMSEPDVRQQLIVLGVLPIVSPPPDELKAFVRAEILRWGRIVRDAGLAGME